MPDVPGVVISDDQTGGTDMPQDPSANQNLAGELIGQAMGQLSGTGVVAQNNFVTVNKALDYDFMEGKRIVDLVEGVGVREVASKQVPAGPSSG